MKKENGVKVYVNRWPKGLDLEELLYRPLILKLLPNLFAGIFRFFIKLTEIIWAGLLIFGRSLAKALVKSVGIVGNFILILGKSLGLVASMLGETIIYYIRKLFFKNLVENKRNPFLEKWYTRFEEGDRVFRLVGSTISYSIVWLLLGLIGTVLFLLLY